MMDKHLRTLFKLIFLFSLVNGQVYDSQYGVMDYYYSLDSGSEWKMFGTIALDQMNNLSDFVMVIKFSENETTLIKDLASVNGLFLVKAVARVQGQQPLFTFTKACFLLDVDSTIHVTVQCDQGGNVMAINLAPKSSCVKNIQTRSTQLSTKLPISFHFPEAGAVPDTTTYVQKLEKEREAKEKGQGQDNRSFLAKYWMYIVPLLLFVVLSGATNGEGTAAAS